MARIPSVTILIPTFTPQLIIHWATDRTSASNQPAAPRMHPSSGLRLSKLIDQAVKSSRPDHHTPQSAALQRPRYGLNFLRRNLHFWTGIRGFWMVTGSSAVHFVPSFFVDPSQFNTYSGVIDGVFNWNSGWPIQVTTSFTSSIPGLLGDIASGLSSAVSSLLSDLVGSTTPDETYISSLAAMGGGTYLTPTKDQLVMWLCLHPASASASNDPVGRLTNYQITSDKVWAVVLATSPAIVVLSTSSSQSQTFNVPAGVSKLAVSIQPGGTMHGTLTRGGQTVIDLQATNLTFEANPTTYNFNVHVAASP
ncbi:hypothetical protein EV702DRAFT_1266421 [Suillus placidus]|uniref:Uncharacterized protein n=1 Tax=Suillus placidus TaxID=48579 RepID=A0A9P7A2Z9_9AGAM|nr:hypothetical protein EV702DRAFT_1266421 [Suillus placidus]